MPRTPFARGEPAPLPWQTRAAGCAPAFVAIWSTGPDTALDGVFRLLALRRGDDGTWVSFERSAQPFLNSVETAASLRMVREFGVRSEELANAPPASEAWRALDEFLGAAPVITADREGFEAWRDRFGGRSSSEQPVLGLADLAALLFPGRLSGARERLVTELCGPERERDAPAAVTPGDVRRALAQLVGRFLALEGEVIAVAAASWLVAWRALVDSDPTRAAALELALALVEQPSVHIAGGAGLFDAPASLVDGRLTASLGASGAQDPAELARDSIEILEPRWSRDAREWLGTDTVPPRDDEDKPFGERDLALLDDVFQVHLPAIFAERTGGAPVYREGQHQVARSVAETLGKRELLLVHAPTGTGKTLAYLVPAMIWATRHGVRIGISTYTRALQQQAVEHELPRARRALLRACALGNASLPTEPRVTLLKGRNNYVCWRALRAHVPTSEDDAEAWLAWSALALFGLTDDSGDLDRMPLRLPFANRAGSHGQRELEVLARQVRAYTACCTAKEDRDTCAAEVTRARAERSHVVITNHAFALAKQAWFKHVVFDECEHLHEQAHSAWSHTLTLRAIRDALGRVRQDGRSSSRAALDRVERVAMPGSPASELVEQNARLAGDAVAALDELQLAIDAFKVWRDEQRRTRDPRDEHSLLREFVLHHDASALRAAHAKLREALESLSVGLAGLAELLDSVPMRGRPRLRRALAIARSDIEEVVAALAAWLPLSDGAPKFQPETFYDVEQDLRGNDVLAARVLLPNEFLGRNYYPQLDSAVFLSATTWLRGSFESAQAYLGLDRAAHPHPDELREPSLVRTFRAPDPFDYSRVIVCVPRDAPAYGASKEVFLAYVRRFIAHLGERTRGRMLVLLTNADETRKLGDQLGSVFRKTRIPFWYQNMPGLAKEELSALFRARVDSILLGVDTFWYGADFPGETLEYLVIVKLPYGVPDRYHHAQCAALGASEQRRRIYLPRALAKFRQGFGRLMRRETDRGCVFVLDARALAPQHKLFLTELPLAGARIAGDDDADGEWLREGARLVTASTEDCVHAALAHMDMLADVRRRGLDTPFDRELGERIAPPPRDLASPDVDAPPPRPPSASRPLRLDPERLEIAPDDLPF